MHLIRHINIFHLRNLSSCLQKNVMSTSSRKKTLIAVCQMTSKNNIEDNFKTCQNLIQTAAQRKAQVVFLPEACDYVGESMPETLSLAEPLEGPLMQRYKSVAKENNVWISLGGIHEKVSDGKVMNAHVVITNSGEIASVYRKAHLFDVNLPEKGIRLQESDYVVPGNQIVEPVSSPVGKIGLGICYDIRFPELSLTLRKKGAEILTYPSAFTFATGAAHWETLLKCRAVETQSYVVAAAQTGAHNKKRTSYGHAMIVDPWGSVISQCSEGTGVSLAEIDLEYVQKVRQEMPVWSHRRPDLYPDFVNSTSLPKDDEIFTFGSVLIRGDTIFYKTALSYAFTNKKCVVPGHVLVAPIRTVKRLSDMSGEEVADLFQVVQKVQSVMESLHSATSSTVAVQDGPEAGQTIKHVHVHILPRKKNDFFNNDEVYYRLQNHDKVEDTSPWRTEEEMAAEAKIIRNYLN